MIKTILSVLSLFVMLSCSMTGKKDIKQQPGMCAKLPMAADGIVRLSKIEVYPEYLEEYMKYATEVETVCASAWKVEEYDGYRTDSFAESQIDK